MRVFIDNGVVCDIIPEEDSHFPGIPVEGRFAPDFLAKCDTVSDDTAVEIGWLKTETGYEAPPVKDPEDGVVIEDPVTGEVEKTLRERVVVLEAQLSAAIRSNSMLEDCLVEMAGMVYA